MPSGWDERHGAGIYSALMLRANLRLYRATRNRSYLEAARRMREASEKLFVDRDTGAFRDDSIFSHLLVETFLDLYHSTGSFKTQAGALSQCCLC